MWERGLIARDAGRHSTTNETMSSVKNVFLLQLRSRSFVNDPVSHGVDTEA